MKVQVIAKILALVLLIAYSSLLTACSYAADFVIINESDSPIDVRYTVKRSTVGPLVASGLPATIEASQLSSHGGQQWKELAGNQYQLIQESNVDIAIVRVMPKEALRITDVRDYKGHSAQRNINFPIEEINITGASGELILTGKQTRLAFMEVSKALYTLTYR